MRMDLKTESFTRLYCSKGPTRRWPRSGVFSTVFWTTKQLVSYTRSIASEKVSRQSHCHRVLWRKLPLPLRHLSRLTRSENWRRIPALQSLKTAIKRSIQRSFWRIAPPPTSISPYVNYTRAINIVNLSKPNNSNELIALPWPEVHTVVLLTYWSAESSA